MNRERAIIAGCLLVLISVAVAVWAYPHLPATMPTHWNLQGHANGYMPRLWGVTIWPAIVAAMWLLMLALPAISPKGFRIDRFVNAFDVAMLAIIGMLVIENVIAVRAALTAAPLPATVFLLVLGVLLVVLGNLMGKFRKNFFIGVRTPWTLASDEVWLRTHRLAGWMLTAAGVLVIACSFFSFGVVAILPIVLIAAFTPVVYSYVIYRQIEGFGSDES